MPADEAVPAGGHHSRHAAGGSGPPGRVTVRDRVLVKIAEQAVAASAGLARGDLSVEVADLSRGLALRVAAPLPIPSLDDTSAIRGAEPLLERIGAVQAEVRETVGRVTGREVARVDVTVTGAKIAKRKRVR